MITFPDTDALSNAALIAAEIVRTGGSFVVSETESPQGITEPSQSLVSEAEDEEQQQQQQVEEQSHPTQGRISPSSYDEDDDEDGGSGSESDEDQGRRVAKSRERNREHARRTRLRKKAQLEALQSRIKGLRAEAEVLKQSLEECSLASILMGLSSHKRQEQDLITDSLLSVATTASSSVACTKDADEIVELVGGKRRRFTSPDAEENKSVSTQPLKLRINGKVTYIGGGRSHINWKTGVYNDDAGTQKQLTQSQLESLRRERNRMHAKMTRDRKKNFIATVEKTIEDLEAANSRMKSALARAVDVHFRATPSSAVRVVPPPPASGAILPVTPDCTSVVVSLDTIPALADDGWLPPAAKRVCLA